METRHLHQPTSAIADASSNGRFIVILGLSLLQPPSTSCS